MSTVLNGTNQQTEWYDLSGATSDASFILEGDFVDAVSVHYSNNPAYSKDSNSYIVDSTTYSAKAEVIIVFGRRFVRFASGNSWTAGKTCTPRPGPTLDKNRQTSIPTPQTNTNNPQSTF